MTMPTGPMFEAFGESKILAEWSRDPRCTVKYMTLRRRMKAGTWKLEDALAVPADPRSGQRAGAEANRTKGESLRQRIRELVADGAPSIKALAEQTGRPESIIHHHIAAMMPDGEDMLAQMEANRTPRAARAVAFGETKTLGQWTRDARCVVSPNTLRKRLAEGWCPEDALITPAWLSDPATITRQES